MICGYLGMFSAQAINVRVAQKASNDGLALAFDVLLRGCTVSGLLVISIAVVIAVYPFRG